MGLRARGGCPPARPQGQRARGGYTSRPGLRGSGPEGGAPRPGLQGSGAGGGQGEREYNPVGTGKSLAGIPNSRESLGLKSSIHAWMGVGK